MNSTWDAAVAAAVAVAVLPVVRWSRRLVTNASMKRQARQLMNGWDPDTALLDLLADHPESACDEHLLLLATVTGVRR